jgi:hypothetical protein
MRDNESKKVFFENLYRISKSLFLVVFVLYPIGHCNISSPVGFTLKYKNPILE